MSNKQNFKIGEQFENYIEKHLFPTALYDLIHRTNSYEQNKERYAEETLRPDFKFRCKKTQQEFYVEAKFRSRFDAFGKIEIAHLKQFRRYEQIVKEEKTLVFFVVGYGGSSMQPKAISLIPIQKIEYLTVFKNFLLKYDIANKAVESGLLDFSIPEHYDFNDNEVITKSKKSKALLFLVPILLVLFSFFYYHNKSKVSIETKLKNQIESYYSTLENGDIDSLHNFINPMVDNWYSKYNVSINDIKKEAKRYNKKYPDTEVHIIWDSFTYKELDDKYDVEYELFYKINTIKKKYHLRINTLLNKDLKIESMKETKF